ncbi:MAG: hypothetical protein K2J66_03075 [Muribaculaceae bacterium]|nr:hypothetical protein [Muribaculaceae bacterium]MDE6756107.1 hypothetical protein [Muribaculaceae bacterium]
MKVYIYTLTILIAALLAVSCGNSVNPANNIAMAREAIAHGDYNDALSALDEASSVMTDSTASAIALTETAALYCVIDEKLQSEDYMDKALGCYGLAVSINPDSVKHCFSRLSPDEKCQLDLLDKLLTARHDIPDYAEPIDSIEIINDIDIIE